MPVKARVLSGDDGVLEVGRDLIHGDEDVALMIGSAVEEGLHAAFDADGGGGRVNEAQGDESERGKQPSGDQDEHQKEQCESHEVFAGQRLDSLEWIADHTSG